MASGFPRWRLWWRLFYSVENTLGSLPMLLLAPIAVAIAGTAWAIAHPSLQIRNGLVVGQPSFGSALLDAAIGAVVGLLALIGVLWVGTWVWYRVLGGDKIWRTDCDGLRHGGSLVWFLRCKDGVVPADPGFLGEVELWVKPPGGKARKNAGEPVPHVHALQSWVRFDSLPAGRYEARWYAAREGEQWRELARGSITLSEADDAP